MTTLITDTSGLYAAMSGTHDLGGTIRTALSDTERPPVVSSLVLAELDYLISTRLGASASVQVIDQLTSGAFDIPPLEVGDFAVARDVVAKYADSNIGLTDAVNVVLAHRYETNAILTLDYRHFRMIVPLSRKHDAFRLLPTDS